MHYMASKLMPIQKMIYEIRGQKVMLDSDLAVLYDVETSNLNDEPRRKAQTCGLAGYRRSVR
jgi:hypothetical protein